MYPNTAQYYASCSSNLVTCKNTNNSSNVACHVYHIILKHSNHIPLPGIVGLIVTVPVVCVTGEFDVTELVLVVTGSELVGLITIEDALIQRLLLIGISVY